MYFKETINNIFITVGILQGFIEAVKSSCLVHLHKYPIYTFQ